MEWVLDSPQIHSTFGSLGYLKGEVYCLNDDCLSTLEEIFNKLIGEDKNLRTFRRAVGFGQNIKKDLIPILIHAKDNIKIVEVTVKILVNLTIPIECLLSVDNTSKNDVGQHTIFELNSLLLSSKEAFLDNRATKAILDYIKQLLEDTKTLPTQLENINNCLLLLRNILHIPDQSQDGTTTTHSPTQNQILWNLFSQSIDKILLYLITCNHGNHWSVTMAQLIALIYKDQHVNTLQKSLNQWLETSLSESSEDNESNTSPPNQGYTNIIPLQSGNGSGESSPVVTSDPTSDSSDTGASGKINDNDTEMSPPNENTAADNQDITEPESNTNCSEPSSGSSKQQPNNNQCSKPPSPETQEKPQQKPPQNTPAPQNPESKYVSRSSRKRISSTSMKKLAKNTQGASTNKKECLSGNEFSDCGYVTQNQESISTSSNEDDIPLQKPAHQKPHVPKPRTNIKPKPILSIQVKKEKRRKKFVKRGKTNIINMKGLLHHTPTDEDITNVLKEFTVEFLVKGFGSLVQNLHSQLLISVHLQIDTSHFFWLVTYFLKFASQLELDLEHVQQVLSFEIFSYLTFEGVNLVEQIQLIANKKNIDLKPLLRRMHLLVTAIREFIQAIDNYEKVPHVSDEDRVHLRNLQLRISSSSDVKCLMVLLLRHYQQNIHTKQYLQDVIVTNHILLLFLDNASKHQNSSFCDVMLDHLRQFATTEIMHPYGMLLETFGSNGEFVNDCIFTMMHHVAGDLQSINTLFQPHILRVFSQIWETDFELCDDWTDLVEYVINTFIKTPRPVAPAILLSEHEIPFEGNCAIAIAAPLPNILTTNSLAEPSTSGETRWIQEDIDSLHWYYTQAQTNANVVDNIQEMFKESGIDKTKGSIITEMFKEEIISDSEFDKLIAEVEQDTADIKPHNDGLLMEVDPAPAIDYNKELEQVDRGVTKMKLETIEEETASTTTVEAEPIVSCSEKEDEDVEIDTPLMVEVRRLVKLIRYQNMGPMLMWLQRILLELCNSKYRLSKQSDEEKIKHHSNILDTVEPIAFHSIFLNQSTPVVPWNSFQSIAIHNQVFLTLLDRLGFHLPSDTGKYFIRIPNFWDCDFLVKTANKLGPIDKCKASLQFPIHEVCPKWKDNFENHFHSNMSSTSAENDLMHDDDNPIAGLCPFRIPRTKQMNPMVQFTPLLLLKLSQIVIDPILSEDMEEDEVIEISSTHSNENLHNSVGLLDSEDNSLCASPSVTSDLTRMYVSDEEDDQ